MRRRETDMGHVRQAVIAALFAVASSAAAVDIDPDPFTFAWRSNVPPDTWVYWDPVTITGIDVPVTARIASRLTAQHSIGCTGSYTESAGQIVAGQSLCVRYHSAASADEVATGVVTVGSYSTPLVISTGATFDTTPDPIVFVPRIGVRRGDPVATAIRVAGLDAPASVSITNGSYSTPRKTMDGSPSFVLNDDIVVVTHVAAGTLGAETATTLTVDGTASVFVSRTIERSRLTSGRLHDINGDLFHDLLWRNEVTGDVGAWTLDDMFPTTMTPTAYKTLLAGMPDWRPKHFGDFDGDLTSDIVWHNEAAGDTAIWLMAAADMREGTIVMAGSPWRVTHVGDFDGDSKSDLVWRSDATGQTAIWLMDGLRMASGTIVMLDGNWSVTRTGDFDGDGRTDLLWRNAVSGETAVWLMNGLEIASGGILPAPAAWEATAVGDFDGDGNDDLFWYNAAIGEGAMWLMNGGAIKAAGRIFGAGNFVDVIGTTDMNADGKTDIVTRDRQGFGWVIEMDGLQFLDFVQGIAPSYSAIAGHDLDGNAFADLTWFDSSPTSRGTWVRFRSMMSRLLLADPNWKLQ
jgi:hypothetical protein